MRWSLNQRAVLQGMDVVMADEHIRKMGGSTMQIEISPYKMDESRDHLAAHPAGSAQRTELHHPPAV